MKQHESHGHTSLKSAYRMALAITTILLVVSLAFFAGCSSDPKALYENKCGSCHTLEAVDSASYSGDEWDAVVKDMQSKTTTISDDDAEKISEYLKTR